MSGEEGGAGRVERTEVVKRIHFISDLLLAAMARAGEVYSGTGGSVGKVFSLLPTDMRVILQVRDSITQLRAGWCSALGG
jgi:hypothetical protein